MEQRKPWHFWLIVAVVVLTLINIFPTVRYYSQPLRAPIDQERAAEVADGIVQRVNQLESDAIEWLEGFCAFIGVRPESVRIDETNAKFIEVSFDSSADTELFKRLLPAAGARIPFVPSQLALSERLSSDPLRVVFVERQFGVRLDPERTEEYFSFGQKLDEEGNPTAVYQELVYDRVTQIASLLAGQSDEAAAVEAMSSMQDGAVYQEAAVRLAQSVVDAEQHLSTQPELYLRYLASFSQSEALASKGASSELLSVLSKVESGFRTERERLEAERDALAEAGSFLESERQLRLRTVTEREALVKKASGIVRKDAALFTSGKQPFTEQDITNKLSQGEATGDEFQVFAFEGRNPFIDEVQIDWSNDRLHLVINEKFHDILSLPAESEAAALRQEFVRKQVFDYIATVSQATGEQFKPVGGEFVVEMAGLPGSGSFITLNLGRLAEQQAEQVAAQIRDEWKPRHADLQPDQFPVWTWKQFQGLSAAERKLGLVVYAPSAEEGVPPAGFNRAGIYVVARGLQFVLDKYEEDTSAEDARVLMEDARALTELLQRQGMRGYPGATAGVATEFRDDVVFAKGAFYQSLIAATREAFTVHGARQQAILEFTDVEQRLSTRNKIDNRIHEDLLKWKEAYQTAQVAMETRRKLEVPPPSKNVYWENLKLSVNKYFRGDEDNVLKWGLDLQGGKTVRLELRDESGRAVTNPEELQQAVNELYTRINKLGVSEQTIRIENDKIVLEFPGSQGLTAADLIRASAMYLHIVNERFGPLNPQLAEASNQFLQAVWNEAVVTNKTDEESVNLIAWRHLGGSLEDPAAGLEGGVPISTEAQLMVDNGLRLAFPGLTPASAQFDETLSRIAVQRVDGDRQQGAHPLMVVFHNYALEGASLTGIQTGYDATRGNFLNFAVQSSYTNREGDPRDDFQTWTAQFSKTAVVGTAKQLTSEQEGWRLAVILNGQVVSAPRLSASLRDSGVIEGGFTPREVSRLASDLKAGSLTYTPRILSETNVSPDLGSQERARGIGSAVFGLVLVVVAMITCYRFAGVIAACAVILNLLIMWGVLQNLDAALTLPGIAGIILTVGMAVDANVLVFERIREEFKHSGRLASAIAVGYRKAFSAIIDSNLTTIIAAVILIQFDAGPIKGFAVTLIIGIISSMFTALFMTRYFFTGWVQKTKATALEMREIFKPSNFQFLKYAKTMLAVSLAIVVLGGGLALSQKQTLLGMEFTGGYSLTVELDEQDDLNYRNAVKDALVAAGASDTDFQVKRLNKPNQMTLQFGQSMEEPGRPWNGMPTELTDGEFAADYERNPRIVWAVAALANEGLDLKESALERLDQNWSVMSGQFSSVMRNNALFAVSAAMLCILLYITVRFEFKYAIAAIAALVHDVLVTFGILGFLHYVGLPIQIDLEVLGAMMTIIGYSLNDTIIIFDRVREDVRIHRKMTFVEVVNHAINITLSRTIMTSATTLLVLIPLVIFGGSAIFPFALVMTIGVVFGTLSSLFIAAPAMLFFHNREQNGHQTAVARA